jgi:hypothetical protein
MPDKALTLLEPLAFVARCPDPVRLQKLREAAIKFCEETEVWTDHQDIVAVAAKDQPIASPDPNGYIYRVASVHEIRDKGQPEEQELLINRHTYQATNDHTILTFDQIQEVNKDFRVRYILVPILIFSQLPDWIIDRWGQVIADGALAAIRFDIGNAQDPNPWAEPNQGALHTQKFDEGVGRCKINIVSDNEGGDTRVEIPVY